VADGCPSATLLGDPSVAGALASEVGGGPSGTTIHITMYSTRKMPPVASASTAHSTRTIEGSMSK